MAKLDCSVDSCIHNSDELCCRGEIDVKGSRACSMCDTCCGSYQKRSGDNASNATVYPNETIGINCEASNCIYNNDFKCTAKSVGIAGYGARDKEETECSTFRER
ncbi:MAG: DUF1540 domain-containing protein [Lachnospiraceae bacterium]